MDDGDLFDIAEEFLGFIRLERFTREDRKFAKAKLEELGLKGPASRIVLTLISAVQMEMKDATAKIREECFQENMAIALKLIGASKSSGMSVINTLDVSAKTSAEATLVSEATGEKTMGDKIRIEGPVQNSAVGSSAKFKARDVNAYIGEVDRSSIDEEIKVVLKQARQAVEAADLPPGDKEDLEDDLGKLSAEMEKPEKDAGRVQKIWNRIKEIAPPIAAILSASASLSKLLMGE